MQYAILNTDKTNNNYGNIWGVYIQADQYIITHSNSGYDIDEPYYIFSTESEFLNMFSWMV